MRRDFDDVWIFDPDNIVVFLNVDLVDSMYIKSYSLFFQGST